MIAAASRRDDSNGRHHGNIPVASPSIQTAIRPRRGLHEVAPRESPAEASPKGGRFDRREKH